MIEDEVYNIVESWDEHNCWDKYFKKEAVKTITTLIENKCIEARIKGGLLNLMGLRNALALDKGGLFKDKEFLDNWLAERISQLKKEQK